MTSPDPARTPTSNALIAEANRYRQIAALQAAKLARVRQVAERWAASDDPHDAAAGRILLAALADGAPHA